ncbi:protein containing Peptidase S9A, oligopeptidase, partial [mine drainage metagenome]
AVSERLAQLWKPLMETGVAWRHARTFLLQREGAMEQPVLTVREPDGTDRVLVDPVATGPTSRAIDWWYPSPSGRFVAYGISDHGNEQSVLYVLEVDTGRLLSDRILWTRQCSLAWEPDDGGFFYTRHPAPESVPTGETHYHRHVFYHRLGSDPSADEEVFGE